MMKTNRRWLQSVILAASAEEVLCLPWAGPARTAALRQPAAE